MWIVRWAWSAMSRSWVTRMMVWPSRVQLLEQAHDLLAGGGVEVSRGLVREQDGRPHHQGARDGHPLALAAGELVGLVGDAVAQVDHLQGAAGAGQPLLLGDPRVDHGQLDVVEGGGARQQVEGLEDEADLAVADLRQLVVAHLRDHLAAQDVVALGGRVQAADEVHERRLARAGRAHDGDVLAGIDGEADPAQGVDLFRAHDVGAPEVLGADERPRVGGRRRRVDHGRGQTAHLPPFLTSSLTLASSLRVRSVL